MIRRRVFEPLSKLVPGQSSAVEVAFAVLLAIIPFSAANAHDGNSSALPWDACDEKQKNDSCSYQNSHHDSYRGTCQAASDDLVCVRNQPIEFATEREDVDDHHSHNDETHQ